VSATAASNFFELMLIAALFVIGMADLIFMACVAPPSPSADQLTCARP